MAYTGGCHLFDVFVTQERIMLSDFHVDMSPFIDLVAQAVRQANGRIRYCEASLGKSPAPPSQQDQFPRDGECL